MIVRRALPYLLLLFALYGGWYYWQRRPVPPLQARLLPFALADIQRFSAQRGGEEEIRFSATTDGWIVERVGRSIRIAAGRPDSLLRALLSMESQGLYSAPLPAIPPLAHLTLWVDDEQETIEFLTPPDSIKDIALVRLNGLPDVYRVKAPRPRQLPLSFADYDSFSLLELHSLQGLDSLHWVTDSNRLALLRAPEDQERLDSLYRAWFKLSGETFAHEFDEVGERDRYLGSYLLYGNRDSVRLSVYRDSLWLHPVVLHGSQFPRSFFWSDSLPFPVIPPEK